MATTEPTPATKPPVKQPEPVEAPPFVEVIDMAGVKMKKTCYADGEVEVEVLGEPEISKADIAATRALQRRRGR